MHIINLKTFGLRSYKNRLGVLILISFLCEYLADAYMNLTIDILQQIANPSLATRLSKSSAHTMLNYSTKNRFLMLYLDTTRFSKAFRGYRQTYNTLVSDNAQTLEAVTRISRILCDANVDHAVFKTIRPYIFTTVDIDIIIFGSTHDFRRAITTVKQAGYERIVDGPLSSTYRDPTIGMGIDLYREVAVSSIPYIDKAKLYSERVSNRLLHGEMVETLSCEADLLCIIAHSLIKEGLYVLSEYYSCVHYLEHLDVRRFLQLAHRTHLERAAKIHMTITALLHKVAHNRLPDKLIQILSAIGVERLESSRIISRNYRFPHRYHPVTVGRCIIDISSEKKTRRGIVDQLFNNLDRQFLRDFTNRLLNHMTRETY